MVRVRTAGKLAEVEASEEARLPGFGGGDPPFPPLVVSEEPVISSPRLGLLMFLAAEVMFFSGLIGGFLVFRLGSPVWPPPLQPRLPVFVTGVNTAFLLLSGITVHLALRSARAGKLKHVAGYLLLTAFLGALFLSVQGYEWVRLVRFGLTMSSGLYGATFYTLIGCHGVHVLAAVLWLGVVLVRALRGRYTAERHTGVELCALYWTFVVALWPVLYGLVYLY